MGTVSRAMYAVQYATEEINLKRIAQAAETGNTDSLMKAFSKLAGDNNFLHGRSEATGGVPLRYHECRKEHAAIERRLEDLAQPEDKELAAMWECQGSGTPASQTLETMSKNSMVCLGLTQEQASVARKRGACYCICMSDCATPAGGGLCAAVGACVRADEARVRVAAVHDPCGATRRRKERGDRERGGLSAWEHGGFCTDAMVLRDDGPADRWCCVCRCGTWTTTAGVRTLCRSLRTT